jgi:pyruvate dehydrogenase E2 component (dihydrolipoamide acetyltransferase)
VTAPKGETTVEDPTPAERTIARRAAEARATVPDLELTVSLGSPGTLEAERLVWACARALREQPRANGAYRDGRFELYSRINIGVVLAAPDHHLIPTVFDADQKEVSELAGELEQLRARAASGQLSAPSFSGATFTLWNAGEHGLAQASMPLVTPQAAAVVAGTDALTLICDHRIVYGARAAAFLTAVKRLLEDGP